MKQSHRHQRQTALMRVWPLWPDVPLAPDAPPSITLPVTATGAEIAAAVEATWGRAKNGSPLPWSCSMGWPRPKPSRRYRP